MKDFKELKVWQKAHLLTLALYRLTRIFPKKNFTVSQARFAGVALQSQPTLLKVAAEEEMQNFTDFSRSRPGRPVSWIITSCSLTTCTIFRNLPIASRQACCWKFGECYVAVSQGRSR